MDFELAKLKEYENDIVGKWWTDKKDSIFEFSPIPKSTYPGELVILTTSTGETSIREYSIWYDLKLEWVIGFKFGFEESMYKVKFLSDVILITNHPEDSSIEEVFTKTVG